MFFIETKRSWEIALLQFRDMSESGHSQSTMYAGRKRRRRREHEGSAGGGGGSRERDRERKVQQCMGKSCDMDPEDWGLYKFRLWNASPQEQILQDDGSVKDGNIHKTPIILKPPSSTNVSMPGPTVPLAGEKPVVLLKPRVPEMLLKNKAVNSSDLTPYPSRSEKEGQRPTQPIYQIQNRSLQNLASSSLPESIGGSARLTPPEKMRFSTKLIDDHMNWCDSTIEYLQEHTDFLVVGVLGLQGAGKSTIMSLLAGNSFEGDQRQYVFKPQSHEIRERGGYQTSGVDFYITQERIIFLDTQPVLSSSILDHIINNERKLPQEYMLPHIYMEMQSLQLAAFLLTVCHLILIVQDWFIDLNLIRFLQAAEMVKPCSPLPNIDGSSSAGTSNGSEYYPHIVFLHNKATQEDFSPENLQDLLCSLDSLLKHSNLKYKGSVTFKRHGIVPGIQHGFLDSEVNLFLLPHMDTEQDECSSKSGHGNTSGQTFSLLPGYKGSPGFNFLLNKLRGLVFSIPRTQLTHATLTEKNW
uniref:Nonsense-mediated mRNA decay factor SMG9 n=1 Tax=Eptatretus burgeri TaxID=7764 RepID=A0A8C4WX67_EPTBU